jgi:hypothetical protein
LDPLFAVALVRSFNLDHLFLKQFFFWQERAYELSEKYKEGKYILELYVH